MQTAVLCTGILGLALVLAATLYFVARVRIEQERTLQKLIERGLSGDELLREAGIAGRPARGRRDLRRGLLLVGLGLAWSAATILIGGSAWRLGIAPVTFGAVYLLLWVVDGRRT